MAEQGRLHPLRSDVDDDRVAEGQADPQVHARRSREGDVCRSRPTCPACACGQRRRRELREARSRRAAARHGDDEVSAHAGLQARDEGRVREPQQHGARRPGPLGGEREEGFANPFARMGDMRTPAAAAPSPSCCARRPKRRRAMGNGIALKTVTTTTSTQRQERGDDESVEHDGDHRSPGGQGRRRAAQGARRTIRWTDHGRADEGDGRSSSSRRRRRRPTTAVAESMKEGGNGSRTPPRRPTAAPGSKDAAAEAAKEAGKQKAADKVKKGLGGLLRRP